MSAMRGEESKPTVRLLVYPSGKNRGSWLSVADFVEYLRWCGHRNPAVLGMVDELETAITAGIVFSERDPL